MPRIARAASIVVVLVATLADAAWSLSLTGVRLVDEDAAIYWYAAREFAALHFREPFFYGQAYHHLGESLLAAPALVAGLPVWIALPAISLLVGVVTWAALARLAWKRGAPGLAVLLLGGPLFLPAGHAILQQRFFGFGLLLVALGLLAGEAAASAGGAALAGFLITLGPALVPNSALLAATGLVWLGAARRGTLRWRWLVVGAGAAIGLHGLGRLFYLLDPSWAVHPAPRLGLSWSLLAGGLADLSRFMGRVTPRVLLHPGLMLAATAAVAAIAAARRRWEVAAPAAVLVLVATAALSIGKVHEGMPSVFFAYDRMFLGLPLGLGLVAIGAFGESRDAGSSTRAMLLCGAIVLGAAAWRWTFLARDVAAEQARARTILDLGEVPGAVSACAAAEAAAKAEGTDLVVFLAHRTLAYACGALAYGRITTIYPPYERRTWIIREEALRRRDLVVVPDVEVESVCPAVLERIPGASCGTGAGGFMVVHMPPMSVVDFARSIGVPVRRF